MNLIQNIKLRKVAAGAVSAGTAVNSTAVDMQGFDGVLFFTTIATANAGNFINAAQGAESSGSDAADLEGTKVVAAANASGVWIDVYKPTDRYVRCEIDRSGTNTATGDIWAIQYAGRLFPEAADNLVTNELIGELHITPAEGTA